MKTLKFAGAFAALALTAGMASAASATTYDLSLPGSQTGLTGVFGKVDVTQINNVAAGGVNQLDFKVTLNQGLEIVDTGGHFAFSFALTGEPAITLVAPAVMTLSHSNGGIGNSPFGGFDYGVNCNGECGPGSNNPVLTPVTFSVRGVGLTESMLGSGSNGVLFAMDTFQSTNCSGSCTAVVGGGILNNTGGVPEPATWAMIIVGMGMVGAGLRMRRRSVLSPA